MTDTGSTSPFDEPSGDRPAGSPTPPPQQPPAYPSYPPMPGYAEGPSGPPPKAPKEIDWASKILYGIGAIGILNTILAFTMRDELRKDVVDRYPDYTPDEVDTAVNVGLGFAVVFGVLFALVYFLLARKILQGRGWARIVATILLALNVLGLLTGSQNNPAVLQVLAVISGLAAVAALLFLWRKPASDFFADMKTRQRPVKGNS
jgi:hypothetical protein